MKNNLKKNSELKMSINDSFSMNYQKLSESQNLTEVIFLFFFALFGYTCHICGIYI